MALTDYTTYADVRGVLGVSDDELEDATLALALYSDHLLQEFDDVSTTLASDFATVAAITPESSRTAVQQRFYRLTRLFAAYAVAKQLGSGLPLFGPKDITDGKATVSRFADSPYRAVLKEVQNKYDELRIKLKEAHAGLSSSATNTVVRSYFSAVGMATDPVTGS